MQSPDSDTVMVELDMVYKKHTWQEMQVGKLQNDHFSQPIKDANTPELDAVWLCSLLEIVFAHLLFYKNKVTEYWIKYCLKNKVFYQNRQPM